GSGRRPPSGRGAPGTGGPKGAAPRAAGGGRPGRSRDVPPSLRGRRTPPRERGRPPESERSTGERFREPSPERERRARQSPPARRGRTGRPGPQRRGEGPRPPRPPTAPPAVLRLGNPRRRIGIGLIAMMFVLSILAGRLVQLQGLESKIYQARAAEQRVQPETIPARRGAITDVNGEALAI